MEDFVYIILVIVWLLVSFLRRKPKKDAPASKPAPAPGDQKEAPPAGETSMEEMLEEFFGGGKKKKKEKPEKPAPQSEPVYEPVYEAADKTRSFESRERDDRWGSDRRDRGRDDRPAASQVYREEEKKDPVLSGYEGQSAVSEDFEFSTKGEVQTIDDLIRAHKKEEALRLAREESGLGEGLTVQDDLPDFDLRTAVIFSEILNKKYR